MSYIAPFRYRGSSLVSTEVDSGGVVWHLDSAILFSSAGDNFVRQR